MDMDKNHLFVKQQIKEAQYKALIWGALITLILTPFIFSVLGFIGAGVTFLLSRGLAFAWFARSVIQFVDPYEPPEENSVIRSAIRELNIANGNCPSSDFILPKRLSRSD